MKTSSLYARIPSFLILLAILFSFAACKNDRSLADGGWLQKRRYEKGYHLNLKSSPNKENQKSLAENPVDPPLIASLDSEIHLENKEDEKTLLFKPDRSVKPNFENSEKASQTKPLPESAAKPTVKKQQKFKTEHYQTDDYHQGRKLNTLSLLSFIFGIISLFFAGIPLGIAALVCGIIGLAQTEKNPEVYKGRGFAIVGMIIGLISVVVVLTVISAM